MKPLLDAPARVQGHSIRCSQPACEAPGGPPPPDARHQGRWNGFGDPEGRNRRPSTRARPVDPSGATPDRRPGAARRRSADARKPATGRSRTASHLPASRSGPGSRSAASGSASSSVRRHGHTPATSGRRIMQRAHGATGTKPGRSGHPLSGPVCGSGTSISIRASASPRAPAFPGSTSSAAAKTSSRSPPPATPSPQPRGALTLDGTTVVTHEVWIRVPIH